MRVEVEGNSGEKNFELRWTQEVNDPSSLLQVLISKEDYTLRLGRVYQSQTEVRTESEAVVRLLIQIPDGEVEETSRVVVVADVLFESQNHAPLAQDQKQE